MLRPILPTIEEYQKFIDFIEKINYNDLVNEKYSDLYNSISFGHENNKNFYSETINLFNDYYTFRWKYYDFDYTLEKYLELNPHGYEQIKNIIIAISKSTGLYLKKVVIDNRKEGKKSDYHDGEQALYIYPKQFTAPIDLIYTVISEIRKGAMKQGAIGACSNNYIPKLATERIWIPSDLEESFKFYSKNNLLSKNFACNFCQNLLFKLEKDLQYSPILDLKTVIADNEKIIEEYKEKFDIKYLSKGSYLYQCMEENQEARDVIFTILDIQTPKEEKLSKMHDYFNNTKDTLHSPCEYLFIELNRLSIHELLILMNYKPFFVEFFGRAYAENKIPASDLAPYRALFKHCCQHKKLHENLSTDGVKIFVTHFLVGQTQKYINDIVSKKQPQKDVDLIIPVLNKIIRENEKFQGEILLKWFEKKLKYNKEDTNKAIKLSLLQAFCCDPRKFGYPELTYCNYNNKSRKERFDDLKEMFKNFDNRLDYVQIKLPLSKFKADPLIVLSQGLPLEQMPTQDCIFRNKPLNCSGDLKGKSIQPINPEDNDTIVFGIVAPKKYVRIKYEKLINLSYIPTNCILYADVQTKDNQYLVINSKNFMFNPYKIASINKNLGRFSYEKSTKRKLDRIEFKVIENHSPQATDYNFNDKMEFNEATNNQQNYNEKKLEDDFMKHTASYEK